MGASRTRWAEERQDINRRFAVDFDAERELQVARARRLAVARERRYRALAEQLTAWFEERGEHMSARDGKIAPANRQRLVNAKDHLARVSADLDVELERLALQEPDVESQLLWVGLVRGGR